MKAFCLQEIMIAGLEMTSRVTPARPLMPITQSVLMKAEGEMIQMTATNLEMVIRINLPATIEREGSLAVPNRLLRDFIAELPREVVQMEQIVEEEEGSGGKVALDLVCGCSKATINGQEAQYFPPVPKTEASTVITMRADEFRKAISRVAFCTASDMGRRPVLTGILMELQNQELVTVGADGFRMAAQRTGMVNPPEGKADARIIVPARVLTEVQRLSDRRGGVVEITIPEEQNNVKFRVGDDEPNQQTDIEVTALLLAGSFPNYGTLIPQDMPNLADFDLSNLVHATRQAALFAKDINNTVMFDIGRNESGERGRAVISSQAKNLGNNEAEVMMEQIKGDNIRIAFNNKYLQDVLAHLGSKRVRLETSSQGSAAKIEIPDESEYAYVMMPILTMEI